MKTSPENLLRVGWDDAGTDLIDLTDAERVALPVQYHVPFFDGLGEPRSWICSVCWGDGWQTSWPCAIATAGGHALAEHLGLESCR